MKLTTVAKNTLAELKTGCVLTLKVSRKDAEGKREYEGQYVSKDN